MQKPLKRVVQAELGFSRTSVEKETRSAYLSVDLKILGYGVASSNDLGYTYGRFLTEGNCKPQEGINRKYMEERSW